MSRGSARDVMTITTLSYSVDEHTEDLHTVLRSVMIESLNLNIPITVAHNKTLYLVDGPKAVTKAISSGIGEQVGNPAYGVTGPSEEAMAQKWGEPEGYNPNPEDRETSRAPAVTITQMPKEEVAAALGAPAPEGPKTDGDGDEIQVPKPVSLDDLKNDFPGKVEGPVVVEMAAKK